VCVYIQAHTLLNQARSPKERRNQGYIAYKPKSCQQNLDSALLYRFIAGITSAIGTGSPPASAAPTTTVTRRSTTDTVHKKLNVRRISGVVVLLVVPVLMVVALHILTARVAPTNRVRRCKGVLVYAALEANRILGEEATS
jgi:hypothetical protein